MLTWKIAWRNLWRHKGKSLVIGIILLLGAFLMTVGNAVVEGAKQGLADNMVSRFTGHLMLAAAEEIKEEVLFGPPSGLKVIPDYPAVKTLLEQQAFVESFLPMTRGMAMILNEDGKSGETFVFGVNFEDYQRTFLNNVVAVEGALLKTGERGILMADKTRELIYETQKFWVLPEDGSLVKESLTAEAQKAQAQGQLPVKDHLVLLGFSTSGTENDIRLPVKGIVRFKSLNDVWAGISFMDIESYRECFGYISAANKAVELSETTQAAFAAENLDDIFADADVVEELELKTTQYDLAAMQQQTQRTIVAVDLDQGAYNLVAVKLKPGVLLTEGENRLRQAVQEAGVGVKVLTWKQATGMVAQFATITQGALSVFVLFIFFVAIIVIMNTLSMAALERTSEIGMMRAVGARKSFVSGMFLAETTLLSMIFGGMGILIGMLTAWGLARLNIPVASNEILSLLFGGDTFHPVVRGMGVVSWIIELAVVTLLAVVYPIMIARKITPLEAISRD